MTVGSDNPFPSVLLVEGDPEALADDPAAGQRRLSVDTSGDLYLTDSSGNATAVGGGSAGSYVWLARRTASASATLDFASLISATYETYEFILTNILPATDATNLLMRFGTGGGPTYDSGANYWAQAIRAEATTAAATGAGAATSILLSPAAIDTTFANYETSGTVRIYHPGSAKFKNMTGQMMSINNGTGGNQYGATLWGQYVLTTAVTAVRFLMSSGNITSGTIDMYGITHA